MVVSSVFGRDKNSKAVDPIWPYYGNEGFLKVLIGNPMLLDTKERVRGSYDHARKRTLWALVVFILHDYLL
jgi:hypothetical protein